MPEKVIKIDAQTCKAATEATKHQSPQGRDFWTSSICRGYRSRTRVSQYWRATLDLEAVKKKKDAVAIVCCGLERAVPERDLRFLIYFEKGDAEASARILKLLMMHSSQWEDALLYDIPQRLVSPPSIVGFMVDQPCAFIRHIALEKDRYLYKLSICHQVRAPRQAKAT
ncbi:hypothetical protein CPB85DRAFT_1321212 [Mucidula mucida]|nr:hypothetical protein CPB85DRAFT_1321212 [Mucidula mucida]